MWTLTSTLLLLACCLWAAEGQGENGNARAPGNGAPETRKSVWEDSVKFKTASRDACTMVTTSQGAFLGLRISCREEENSSYWCEYGGIPKRCLANGFQSYFERLKFIMWSSFYACMDPVIFWPSPGCKRAPGEPDIIQIAEGRTEAATTQMLDRSPERQLSQARPEQSTPAQPTNQPTKPAVKSNAEKMAEEYCWQSFQGVCTYVIGWFQNECRGF
ncbi:fibroblast growth factor-binding protein 2-like [Hypomesus transpacificus]|uniref:fibroblast growth factor-binding protein 2-like n=1 Tax=Hypomesus transpacificus TaxID=137520 RepID=UPI001F079E08|nr:fibroblast growth factor-binding protein 2-like [Hypomesus transpacificus]